MKDNKEIFESEISRKFFGRGININHATRDELKDFLDKVPSLMKATHWLEMVGLNYIGDICSWGDESLQKKMSEVKRDCDKVLTRLEEMATPAPPVTHMEHPIPEILKPDDTEHCHVCQYEIKRDFPIKCKFLRKRGLRKHTRSDFIDTFVCSTRCTKFSDDSIGYPGEYAYLDDVLYFQPFAIEDEDGFFNHNEKLYQDRFSAKTAYEPPNSITV